MVFATDRQRKAVMAKLRGSTKSSISPQIIGKLKIQNLKNLDTQIINIPKNKFAHIRGNKVLIVGKDVRLTTSFPRGTELEKRTKGKIFTKIIKD